VLDPARSDQIKVAPAILRDFLLAKNRVLKRAVGNQVTLVFLVKELDRQVVLEVDNASVFEAEVKVLLLDAALTRQDQVLRVLANLVAGLEEAVLTVELHVPGDRVDQMLMVVNQVELEQVFYTG
jgi:alkyl sulfatase BDS1-like metallo-beta-lactamase superfamily hydrolase